MRTAFFLLCMLLMSSTIFSQWSRTNGPEGAAIRSLVNIDGIIYAGTEVNGVYSSQDDGLSWSPVNTGIETYYIESISSKSGNLFAGTFGYGVYRSSDGGQTWIAPSNAANLAVTALVVQDSFIFAGDISDGVYRSSDSGQTWTQKLNFFGMGPMCISGNTIFASSSNYTYGSTDYGETWFNVDELEGATIFSYYTEDSLIIAGGRNKIYKSINYGNSFQTIDLNFPFSITNIYDIDAIGSTLFMATSYDGVYKSIDGGLTWTQANHGMGPKNAHALAVSDAATLIAGTQYVGMYRSTDMGANWNKSLAGFLPGLSIESMLSANSFIFAGTRDGVYRTGDNGRSWTKLGGANDTVNYSGVRGLCEKDGEIYAGMRIQFHATVYKTKDNGETWTRAGSGLPSDLVFVDGLAASGGNIIAATDDGVYYTSDDGESWHQANISNYHNIEDVAAGGGYAYAIVPGDGIYRSPDGGVNWYLSLGSTLDYVALAALENYVFAGTFFTGARYSTNNGTTWHVSSGFPSDASVFAFGPVGDGIVLAGTDLGPSWIYASFDNGNYYSQYSGELAERASVEAFAVNDSFMFAGTDDHGVWRRLRPGVVSVQTPPDVPQTFDLAQNFPNPFNPTTTIRYDIPQSSKISLTIYNIVGEKVRTLFDDFQSAGSKTVVWDGRNDRGQLVSSGVYIYQMQAGDFVSVKKMIFMK